MSLPQAIKTVRLMRTEAFRPPTMATPELIVQNLVQRLKKAQDQKSYYKLHAIIRDVIDYLVAEVSSSALASDILKACAAARSADREDGSLSTFFSVGGMCSPLYRLCLRTNIKDKTSLEILSLAMIYAVPPSPDRLDVHYVRHACMVQDNQPLFEYLRSLPEYRYAKPYHEVYLTKPDMHYLDRVEVQPRIIPARRLTSNSDIQGSGPHQACFTAQFSIPMFQARIRAMGEVTVEFIAQGRMWALTFCKSTFNTSPRKPRFPWHRDSRRADTELSASSQWEVKLCLRDESDPTPVQANLAFSPCRRATSASSRVQQPTVEMDKGLGHFDLELCTRPGSQLWCPSTIAMIARSAESRLPKHIQTEVCSSLDNGVLGSSGSIYIEEDGTLVGALEAVLAMTVRRKPQWRMKKQKPVDVARKAEAQETDLASVCQ